MYSINDVERLSGIKSHTIRVWEKRYGIVSPRRSDGNTRYYSETDVKKLKDIALLKKHGYKISVIASMCTKEMETEVAKHLTNLSQEDTKLDSVLSAVRKLDEYTVYSVIDHCIEKDGFTKAMEYMIFPLLEHIHMLLLTGSLSQIHEKFVIGLVRRKLINEIDCMYKFVSEDAQRVFIYLPRGESHELSMLYVHLLLLDCGVNVLNLNEEIDSREVQDVCAIFKPDLVFTVFNESFMNVSLQSYVENVATNIGDAKFIITGFAAISQHFDLPRNVLKINCIQEIKNHICTN